MTELDIAGIGIWGHCFSNWQEFSHGIQSGVWQPETRLQPQMIPARERRRAPQSVKLAVEVMSQACEMAQLDPSHAASVFSSSMGDMQITDYMCTTLATPPRLVSPTRFHNSVHNATTGYWSIASHSHASSNAVSAHAYTAPMAFLEAAIQVVEDQVPVLLVTQEMAAPLALHHTCPSDQPFSSALLLTSSGQCENPLASIQFSCSSESVDWLPLPGDLQLSLSSNYGAGLLPLFAALAEGSFTKPIDQVKLEFPLSPGACLKLAVSL